MVINYNRKKYDKTKVEKVECIEISQILARFILIIDTTSTDTNKSILVVMKNPSQATKYQSDKTVNNVINNLYDEYKTIYIANLYPYYSTKANGLLGFLNSKDNGTILEINQKFVEEYAKKTDDILIGWGTNTIGMKQSYYEDAIKKTMNILLKTGKDIYFVHCCSCKSNISGCGNNMNCNNRCKKRCKRQGYNSNNCDIIRFPMHLELWDTGKNKIKY